MCKQLQCPLSSGRGVASLKLCNGSLLGSHWRARPSGPNACRVRSTDGCCGTAPRSTRGPERSARPKWPEHLAVPTQPTKGPACAQGKPPANPAPPPLDQVARTERTGQATRRRRPLPCSTERPEQAHRNPQVRQERAHKPPHKERRPRPQTKAAPRAPSRSGRPTWELPALALEHSGQTPCVHTPLPTPRACLAPFEAARHARPVLRCPFSGSYRRQTIREGPSAKLLDSVL